MTTQYNFNIFLPSGEKYNYTLTNDGEHLIPANISGRMLQTIRSNIAIENNIQSYQVNLFKMGEEDEIEDFDLTETEIQLFALIRNIQKFDDIKELEFEPEKDGEDKPVIDWLMLSNITIDTIDTRIAEHKKMSFQINIGGDNGDSQGDGEEELIHFDKTKCCEFISYIISAVKDKPDNDDSDDSDDSDDDTYEYTIQEFRIFCDGTIELYDSNIGGKFDEGCADISF
jgi:hypothetical protein